MQTNNVLYGKIRKKAQMKIQQMALMLLAVTLFFVIVGLVVLTFVFSGTRDSAQNQQEQNAITLAMKIANSAELSCGRAFGTGKINCIDADKVMVLKEQANKYSDFFGVSNIGIYTIFPITNQQIECNLGNYPNCNYIRLFDKELTGFGQAKNFVTLCRKENLGGDVYDKCELAMLVIEEKVVGK